MVPEAVFVYGTLKQGQRNFWVSQEAGWVRSEPAYIEGFQLFHIPEGDLRPYAYPGVVKGEGRVWGEVQWFADLAQALVLLDELEDEGGEYLRSPTTAYLQPTEQPCTVWVYTYPSLQAVQSAGGIWLPEGVWGEEMQPKG
ncbi:gamma-glutamylcyclotransferase [Meiothermus sp.]|uniref:gamma-glutamylcyclotransferase family protein n=1 Tax=Meiothermus sp. TaxID=1955249 RepID=UPI0021DC8CB3|nr:gamma-glutamylcyclotransferase family protein [Meiothermus sp.]GIW26632.1 MAG: gamma-glutamylcyclotransferase [Meiothermus sp.]